MSGDTRTDTTEPLTNPSNNSPTHCTAAITHPLSFYKLVTLTKELA